MGGYEKISLARIFFRADGLRAAQCADSDPDRARADGYAAAIGDSCPNDAARFANRDAVGDCYPNLRAAGACFRAGGPGVAG